jgi:uncharacterized protein DUF3592
VSTRSIDPSHTSRPIGRLYIMEFLNRLAERFKRFVGGMAIATLCLTVVGLGSYHYFEHYVLIFQGEVVDGVLTGKSVQKGSRNSTSHYLHYEFEIGGYTRQGKSSVWSWVYNGKEKGESVSVIYLPSHPSINHYGGRYGALEAAFFTTLGLLFLGLLGVGGLWYAFSKPED